jgi:host factor-I protein
MSNTQVPAQLLMTGRQKRGPLRKKGVAEMQKTQNLQDQFLNQLRKEKSVVTMFLMNGFQLHGVVRGFDGFTVVLDSDGRQQLIYKHAISTVVPPRPIPFDGED